MATLTVTATVPPSAVATDRARLYVGTENAGSLAASTPAGGEFVEDIVIGDRSSVTFEHRLTPDDPCAALPVGVALVDAAGNASLATEQIVTLADPPAGVNDLAVAIADDGGGAIAGAADLAWTASPDVTAAGASATTVGIDLLDVLGAPFDLVAEVSVGSPGYAVYERPTVDEPAEGDTLVATLGPDVASYRYTGAAGTQRYVYIRALGCSGQPDTEPTRRKLRRVAFDASGQLILPAPNTPIALSVEPTAGGTLRVRFAYRRANEEASVASFKVFAAEDPAAIDPDATPAAETTYATPQGIEIGPLTDGVTVKVAVLAEAESGARSSLTDEVSAVADATPPAAPTGIAVEVA